MAVGSFNLSLLQPREPDDLHRDPFHSWGPRDGPKSAEFYRLTEGYLVRIVGHADFYVCLSEAKVVCRPVPRSEIKDCETLYHNTILPLISNFLGGLNIHASASVIGDCAFAFAGISGRGKTTLAAALARTGYPILTEDCLAIAPASGGYMAEPHKTELRLFDDSVVALDLEKQKADNSEGGIKNRIRSDCLVPFHDRAIALGAIFFLGSSSNSRVQIEQLSAAQSLTQLLQHSMILDVDDKERLRSHFDRLRCLAELTPCFWLDYPRDFRSLPIVIDALIRHREQMGVGDASE